MYNLRVDTAEAAVKYLPSEDGEMARSLGTRPNLMEVLNKLPPNFFTPKRSLSLAGSREVAMSQAIRFGKMFVILLFGIWMFSSCSDLSGGKVFQDIYEGMSYSVTFINQSDWTLRAKKDYVLIGTDNSVNPTTSDFTMTIPARETGVLTWESFAFSLVGYTYFGDDAGHDFPEFNKMFSFTIAIDGLPGDTPFLISGWPEDQADDHTAGIYGFLYRPENQDALNTGLLSPTICSNLLPQGKAFPEDRLPGFVVTISPEGNVSIALDTETLKTLVDAP